MKLVWSLLAASSLIIISCSKKDNSPGKTPTSMTTEEDLLKDSVYLYTKEVYFWQDLLPGYDQFKPRQYTGSTELESAQAVMNAIRKLQPLDRFSFVTTEEQSNSLQTGEDKDFGFFIKAASIDKADPLDSIYWFVTYAYDQSSAGQAGVQRGWYINKVNGTAVSYDQSSADVLNNVFFGSPTNATFEFKKPDGTTVSANLAKTSFTANSVLYKNVVDAGGKRVGYMVFNQFFGQPSRNELAQAFTYFQAQGIDELVVDLRYNPGGSVETEDTLSNLIAPTAANNQTMYQYIFNSTLQNNQHQLIRKKLGYGDIFTPAENTVKFEKAGALNLPRVFFIVTGNTASASELLINNLKPYMEVKLIGDTTYGKPVGFFPIPIFNYDIYPISFKTVNSAGNADYYTGFAPDNLSSDGVNKNWGDITEPSLAAALRYISTGSFARAAAEPQNSLQRRAMNETKPLNKAMNENKFSGMFIERK
ncbi:MAG TPA: S41 family peptidase [Chitinophagaceae bacterium]|nr:S41 family peptidase [Chitinophagaceae bacterium]